MSHYIIVNGVRVKGGHQDLVASDEPPESVEYQIKYTPDHALTPDQVGDRVTKILKLAAKIEDAAVPDEEPAA